MSQAKEWGMFSLIRHGCSRQYLYHIAGFAGSWILPPRGLRASMPGIRTRSLRRLHSSRLLGLPFFAMSVILGAQKSGLWTVRVGVPVMFRCDYGKWSGRVTEATIV
jgi:hypothetical protein